MGAIEALVLLSFLFCLVLTDEMYSTRFDNIDFEEILKNERLLQNYANCLLDKGGCTAEGKELKSVLPDALQTDCSKCSDVQKKGAKKVINYLARNKEDIWDQLLAKYDPSGDFKERFGEKWLE